MNKIKFSHKYTKFDLLTKGTLKHLTAILLQVFKINYTELSNEFMLYDSSYGSLSYLDNYPLPTDKAIVLLFQNYFNRNRLQLFTTIRIYTPEKYEYYKSKMGEIFEIVIKED